MKNKAFVLKSLLFFVLVVIIFPPLDISGNRIKPAVNESSEDCRVLISYKDESIFNDDNSLFSVKSDFRNELDYPPLSLPEYNPCLYSQRYNLSSRGSSVAASVVQTAYKYLGVPYVWGGTTPAGFDCSGFVQRVYAENGVSIPRTADVQFEAGKPVIDLEPGDLVFFTTYAPGASHVGIYLANSYFIHASSSGYVRINSLQEDFYKSVFLGGKRYFN